MKLIFATGIFPPDIGGPATYVEKLALELKKRDFEVKIVTYADTNAVKSQISEIPVVRISRRYPKGLRHFIYFWHLLWLARSANVIYAQNITSAGFPAILVSRILKIFSGCYPKVVMRIAGNYAWEKSSMKGWFSGGINEFGEAKSFRIRFLKEIQGILARRADAIIVPCQYLSRAVNGWGVPENKIKVVYNTAEDLPSLNISKEEAQNKIGVKGMVILSIGRLDPWKGFPCLVEIMKDLVRVNPNFKLLIVGEGDEVKKLKSEIKNLELEANVKLCGRVPRFDLPLFFKAADVFVLNSAQEGFSHVILEAMQQEVAVITTDEGGNSELIEQGVGGILVEYNNKNQIKEAIVKLANDKNLRKQFTANSKMKLQKFTLENLVAGTIKVLKS